MPNNKTGTTSASKKDVTKVKGAVGRPSQSVQAIREEFSLNDERSKQNYAAAMEALKQLRDPNRSSTVTINAYDRETIRGYLQKPASNQSNLIKAANYFFIRSQIFFRIVFWYATMWDLNCRKVIPPFDFQKGLDSNALKQYGETLDQLDIYNLDRNMVEVLIRVYLEDACFFLFFRDDTGAFPFILNPEECMIDGRYMTGDLSFAIDMSKWRSQQRQNLIEWLGAPLDEMWREYQSSGNKWVHVPDEYAGCLKFRIEDLDTVIPPLAPIMQQIAGLNDLEDLQAIADQQSVYKLLILPMKTISGSKVKDDFQVDPKVWLEYFDRMVIDALPDYVSAAPMPGDGLEVVDFSTTSIDKDSDRYANAQKNILNTAGGGPVLSGNAISSAAAFETWKQAESDFAISTLIGQITGFTNRMLSYDISKPCKVEYFSVTSLIKEKVYKQQLELNQNGFMGRIFLGTLNEISEKETMAMLAFETDVLRLPEIMVHPLETSYTQSGKEEVKDTDPVEGGAPKKDATELTPEGDADRNQ